MLILTRRVGEALMVGDDTKIVVLGVKGSQIRLGINAPKDIVVHREEIFDNLKQNAKKFVAENYNLERIAKKYINLWKFLLKS